MKRKRLDIFILKSFLLLFVAAFCICLFILLMNILWRYINDLVGKGFSFGIISKFFYYFGLTLVPEALPLAALLASLITFGNFGERLELLAMKTAGISLLRIMRPLTIFCIVLTGVSFYFQNVVVPHASTKLYSLYASMMNKNPELEIPEGVFYDQIRGFNMYVKHKDIKTGNLYDVTIYDHRDGYENLSVIVSDSAFLETTADKHYLVLHLFSGEQFCQEKDLDSDGKPYRRESFREKHVLLEFNSDFEQVDESLMRDQAASKNMVQIRHTIDSLSVRQDSIGLGNLSEYRATGLAVYRLTHSDSLQLAQLGDKVINADSIFAVSNRSTQVDIRGDMRSKIQTQASDQAIKSSNMFAGDKTIRRNWIEWMKKITNAISILVFFFIGAPLGAIIRKGGLGVPIIVAVFTYILYYITSISGQKMFREGEWSIVGCWLSTIVLTPLSVFFTIKANSDSTVFQIDVIKEFFRHWFGGKVSRNIVRKDVVIEDPDTSRCLAMLENVRTLSVGLESSDLLSSSPNYRNLFFGEVDAAQLEALNVELENLVAELGNSRDRVELDLLNGFPVVPSYGVEAPFEKVWANRFVGVVFPLGLLFMLRAWLFSKKIRQQMGKSAQVAGELIEYMNNNKHN
ncbi:MAG: LptF/LptG family permease [Bacteroidaceae bacterium]|nr:LptF/LptG family permease [Bacteroidaceae bacterium]